MSQIVITGLDLSGMDDDLVKLAKAVGKDVKNLRDEKIDLSYVQLEPVTATGSIDAIGLLDKFGGIEVTGAVTEIHSIDFPIDFIIPGTLFLVHLKTENEVDLVHLSETGVGNVKFSFSSEETLTGNPGEALPFLVSKNEDDTYVLVYVGGASGGGKLKTNIPVVLPGSNTFGKYSNGDTIQAIGKTLEEVIRDATFAFLVPAFSGLSIQGIAATVELGYVLSGNKNFLFSLSNSGNVINNTLSVIDVTNGNTVLVSLRPKTSPATANVGAISKTVPGTHEWRIQVTDTINTVRSSSTVKLNFMHNLFYGPSATIPTDSASARALPNTRFENAGLTFTLNTGNVHKDFELFVPVNMSFVSATDQDALNAGVTYTLVNPSFFINDIGGTPREYKHYRNSVAAPYGSNHRHNIILSN